MLCYMAKKTIIPLDDTRACELVIRRAQRENRSRRNALITTVIEALGGPNTEVSQGRSFKAEIIKKSIGFSESTQ